MDIENTPSFAEESLDELFELDIRVSSIADEESSLLLTDIDCVPPTIVWICGGG